MVGTPPRSGNARALVKNVVERVLLSSGWPERSRRRRSATAVVLAYHNIISETSPAHGDRSLHLPRRDFAAQLDALMATHDVVPLDRVLDAAVGAMPPAAAPARPLAAITFDDAYRGAVTLGVEELARRSLPATIFISPERLGDAPFWWDQLASPERGEVEPGFRELALGELAGQQRQVLDHAAALDLVPYEPTGELRSACVEELQGAARTAGITFASHGWSHANLAALAGAELEMELVRPLEWLRAHFPAVLPVLSYPYGRSSPDVERAAASAGYRAALCIDGGCVEPSVRPFALPRVNMPSGVSTAGFRLRLAGWFVA